MSNFLNSAYTAINDLVTIEADSLVSTDITTETLEITTSATLLNTTSTNTTLDGTLVFNTDIIQSGIYKINQLTSTGVNKMSDILLNNDSDINLYATSSLQQFGSTAQNNLQATNITGLFGVAGNITQSSGSTILGDSSIGNISQNNKSISQIGTVSNTLKNTTITDLIVTNSIVLPDDVSIPGSTYNNDDINMTGTGIINQSGTGTNVFKKSDFIGDVLFDANVTMTNASSTAVLKTTTVTSLSTSGNITQSSGSVNIKSVVSNDITMNNNFDLTMGGDGVIVQTGTGTNELKDTEITNLTILDTVIFPSGFTYPLPTFSIGTVTDLSNGTPPTVTLTGTNSNPILSFGLERGAKGDTGSKGDDGSKGDKGSKGDDGSDGDTGPPGDSSVATAAAIAAAAAAVASAASAGVAASAAVASAASAAASAVSSGANAAAVTALTTRVTTLETEVDLLIVDVDVINTDITALALKTSNMISIAATSTIIDCPSISIGEIDNTLLQLGPITSATSIINVGPTSQFGTVVINGFVTFPLMTSFFGYGISNGFINQFA